MRNLMNTELKEIMIVNQGVVLFDIASWLQSNLCIIFLTIASINSNAKCTTISTNIRYFDIRFIFCRPEYIVID